MKKNEASCRKLTRMLLMLWILWITVRHWLYRPATPLVLATGSREIDSIVEFVALVRINANNAHTAFYQTPLPGKIQ